MTVLAPVLALATLLTEPAVARTEADASATVVVRSASELGFAEATVQRALEGHFADLGYEVYVDFAPDDRPWPPAAVRVELLRHPDGSVGVAVQRESDTKPWVRTLPGQDDAGLMLESLSVLIRSMLSAPLPEPTIEPEPQPEPEPEPQPTPEPAPPPWGAQWGLAIGYRGDTLGADHRWHSSGALDLEVRTPVGLAVGGGASYTPHHPGAGLSVQRVGGQLRVGAVFRARDRVQPGVFATATAEGLGFSGAPSNAEARPGWAPRVGAGAFASLRVLLGPERPQRWFVTARVGLVGWILGATLEETSETGRRPLLRTDPVAGTVWVGVGYRWTQMRSR